MIEWADIGNFRGLTLLAAGPFRYGHSAVGLFIVLSGFSLMLPVSRRGGILQGGAWPFFMRRARRILPAYYGAMGLTLALIYFFLHTRTVSVWNDAIPVTFFDVWTHLLLLQDLFSYGKISPPFWSISVEWRIYFLFPLLVLLFKRQGGLKTTLGMLALAMLVFAALRHTMFLGIMPAYFVLFTMGMLASEVAFSQSDYSAHLRNGVPWHLIRYPAFLTLLFLLFIWRNRFSSEHLFIQDLATGVFSALLLISLSIKRPSRLRSTLSFRPLVFIGSFAYSIYLIHMPFVQLVWQYGIHPFHRSHLESFFLLVACSLPGVVGVSYLFSLIFERPFMGKPSNPAPKTEREAEIAAIESPAP